jgi:hypothetical protein
MYSNQYQHSFRRRNIVRKLLLYIFRDVFYMLPNVFKIATLCIDIKKVNQVF